MELALRFGGGLMRDRLDLSAAISMTGPGGTGGGFQRVEAGYDVSDNAKIILGAVNYDSGSKAQFATIGDKDRVYAKFEYRF